MTIMEQTVSLSEMPGACPWCLQVLLPHRDDIKIENLSVSQGYLVVFQRQHAQQVQPLPCLLSAGALCLGDETKR